MSFNETASASGFAYAKYGISTGSLVTSSSTAIASSEISESDAYNKAYSIARSEAQSVANNNANIIEHPLNNNILFRIKLKENNTLENTIILIEECIVMLINILEKLIEEFRKSF